GMPRRFLSAPHRKKPPRPRTRGGRPATPRRRTRTIPRPGPPGDRNMNLVICLVATAAILLYIFYPGKLYLGPEKTRASYLRERKDSAYENLRDLNFEYKAGKVPDADYQSLKNSLEDEAATLLAEINRLESASPKKAKSC